MRLGTVGAALVAMVAVLGTGGGARAQEQPAPAKTATGIVSGVVLDKATGDPIIEAGVEVVEQNEKTKTDIDGRFKLKLPPGIYQLRIYAPLYGPVRLQGVIVKEGKVTKADATLAAAAGNVDVVEVVAQADRAAEATQLTARKKSAVVADMMSAEVIKKTTGRDAAEVVKRVPAVTIKDNKFIFIRGLGERYSSALLNGSRLPSPDPDRRVVPLDLFPADFIESLAVIKSYTPDLPGDFSGGLVDIHAREFPDHLTFSTGASTGGNTQTTFQSYRTYRGGDLDWLGLGKDFRSLPDNVPDSVDFTQLSQRAKNRIGLGLRNIWDTRTDTAPPNHGFNLSAGDSFGPLGVSVAGVYTGEYQSIPDRTENQFVNGGRKDPIKLDSHFTVDDSLFKTRLGGLLTASYKLTDNQKLFVRSLVDHNSFDDVTFALGEDTQGNPQRETILRYTEEELDFGQVGGEHHWNHFWFDWRSAFSRTKQDEPDTRYITYKGTPPKFTDDSLGGSRIFNKLSETLTDSAGDITIPFSTGLPLTDVWSGLPAKLKFGGAYAFRDRTFEQRRFVYNINKAAFDLTQPPETILDPSNQIPGLVDFDENTQPGDAYDVTHEILGGYGMFDLPIVRDHLRLVAGVRMEYSYINLKTTAIGVATPVKEIKNNLDPLPGANLIFTPIPDMNLRFGYSQSVSRPEFRELSPTQYPSPRGLRALIGNPLLVEANIENWDARWEWFFSPLELVSLSFFRKNLTKPIEQTVIVESSLIADSFRNAKDGTLTGFEFEGRKDFGFVHRWLKPVSLLANVAYIDATVNVPKAKKLEVQTTTSRPLQGQAPYIANAALEYAHPWLGTYRLLYYTAGERITAAGSFGLADIVEQPRHQLDAVVIVPVKPFGLPLTLKGSAENLLDDRILYTEGTRIQRRYETGVKVSLGVAYTFD